MPKKKEIPRPCLRCGIQTMKQGKVMNAAGRWFYGWVCPDPKCGNKEIKVDKEGIPIPYDKLVPKSSLKKNAMQLFKDETGWNIYGGPHMEFLAKGYTIGEIAEYLLEQGEGNPNIDKMVAEMLYEARNGEPVTLDNFKKRMEGEMPDLPYSIEQEEEDRRMQEVMEKVPPKVLQPGSIVELDGEFAMGLMEILREMKLFDPKDEGEDPFDVFDDNIGKTEEWVKKQVQKSVGSEVEVVQVSFEEADSGNSSHASVYYSVTLRGPLNVLKEVTGEDKVVYVDWEEGPEMTEVTRKGVPPGYPRMGPEASKKGTLMKRTAGLEKHVDEIIEEKDPGLRNVYQWSNGLEVLQSSADQSVEELAEEIMEILEASGEISKAMRYNPEEQKIEFGPMEQYWTPDKQFKTYDEFVQAFKDFKVEASKMDRKALITHDPSRSFSPNQRVNVDEMDVQGVVEGIDPTTGEIKVRTPYGTKSYKGTDLSMIGARTSVADADRPPIGEMDKVFEPGEEGDFSYPDPEVGDTVTFGPDGKVREGSILDLTWEGNLAVIACKDEKHPISIPITDIRTVRKAVDATPFIEGNKPEQYTTLGEKPGKGEYTETLPEKLDEIAKKEGVGGGWKEKTKPSIDAPQDEPKEKKSSFHRRFMARMEARRRERLIDKASKFLVLASKADVAGDTKLAWLLDRQVNYIQRKLAGQVVVRETWFDSPQDATQFHKEKGGGGGVGPGAGVAGPMGGGPEAGTQEKPVEPVVEEKTTTTKKYPVGTSPDAAGGEPLESKEETKIKSPSEEASEISKSKKLMSLRKEAGVVLTVKTTKNMSTFDVGDRIEEAYGGDVVSVGVAIQGANTYKVNLGTDDLPGIKKAVQKAGFTFVSGEVLKEKDFYKSMFSSLQKKAGTWDLPDTVQKATNLKNFIETLAQDKKTYQGNEAVSMEQEYSKILLKTGLGDDSLMDALVGVGYLEGVDSAHDDLDEELRNIRSNYQFTPSKWIGPIIRHLDEIVWTPGGDGAVAPKGKKRELQKAYNNWGNDETGRRGQEPDDPDDLNFIDDGAYNILLSLVKKEHRTSGRKRKYISREAWDKAWMKILGRTEKEHYDRRLGEVEADVMNRIHNLAIEYDDATEEHRTSGRKGESAGGPFHREAVAPPGWEGTVKEMKDKPEIDNPWALCLSGDTEVLCLDGKTRTVKAMAESSEEFWVYSMDQEQFLVVPGKAQARFVGPRRAVKLTLDNGKTLICSPEHRWMMRDGTFKETKDLVVGDSFVPFRISYGHEYGRSHAKHTRVYQPGLGTYGMTSKMVLRVIQPGCTSGDYEVHHKNENSQDDRPENLEWLEKSKHAVLHYSEKASRLIDPNRKENLSASRLFILKTIGKENCNRLWEDTEYREKMIPILRANAKRAGENAGKVHTAKRLAREVQAGNHKVVKVEFLDRVEPMYDVSVDGYHTFGVSVGIFSHNSWHMKDKGYTPGGSKKKKKSGVEGVEEEVLIFKDPEGKEVDLGEVIATLEKGAPCPWLKKKKKKSALGAEEEDLAYMSKVREMENGNFSKEVWDKAWKDVMGETEGEYQERHQRSVNDKILNQIVNRAFAIEGGGDLPETGLEKQERERFERPASRKTAAGECSICGEAPATKSIGHWYVCNSPECTEEAKEHLKEDGLSAPEAEVGPLGASKKTAGCLPAIENLFME